ncbi:MAG TPA: hypothetical protein VF514_13670, partial [Bacteroidota bacterium]
KFIARGLLRVLVVATAVHVHSPGQTSLPPLPPREQVPALMTFLSPLLIPKVLQDCYLLKEYIRSEELVSKRDAHGDLYAVDCVFDRAMRLCWNNVYEALLVSAFALMDHQRVGVRLPLIGAILWFPLTSEFTGEFRARIDALPSRLYADTPPGQGGDRDKLQHFFGSAFLTAVTESAESADRFGLFIEWGEENFIVGGVNDERDVRANRQGERFGLHLLSDPDTRPSRFFTTEVPRGTATPCDHGAVLPDSLESRQEAK